jgi:hypothetical protein
MAVLSTLFLFCKKHAHYELGCGRMFRDALVWMGKLGTAGMYPNDTLFAKG